MAGLRARPPYMAENARAPQRTIGEAERAEVELASGEATMEEAYNSLWVPATTEEASGLLRRGPAGRGGRWAHLPFRRQEQPPGR